MLEATEYIVLEIATLEDAEIAGYIDDTLRNRDFTSELEGQFLILGFPVQGKSSLIQPGIFNKYFEHMSEDPGITLKRYSKKIVDDDPTRKTFVRGRT